MNAKPRLTIGIPFFNTSGRIRWAIQSVLRQTFRDWELLLVDDGSTDADSRIGEEYAGNPHIRYIRDGRHLGLAPRLNYIAQLARGEYLARMDADDIMHPDRLSEQVTYLEANPRIDVVGTDVYLIDQELNIRGRGLTRVKQICSRLSYLQFWHPTITGHTEWFLKNPYCCDYLRCEDAELWIRTCGDVRCAVIRKPLFFYNLWAFRADKSRLSLRQYQQILNLYKTRMCLPCRIREIAFAELKRTVYSIVDLLGLVERYLERSCLPVESGERRAAQALLREIVRDTEHEIPCPNVATRPQLGSSRRIATAPAPCRGVSVVYGEYGTEAPYNPPADVPELRRFSASEGPANKAVYALRRIFLANGLDRENYGSEGWNPLGLWIKPGMKVVLKPNWVRHEWSSLVGQNVLCTHPSLIRALIDYCLIALNGEGEVTVADAPLQGADFEAIVVQQGIWQLREHYAGSQIPVRFMDLRMEWAEVADGTGYIKARHRLPGDAKGYSIIDLGDESMLAALDQSGGAFAVGDYDSRVTNRHHIGGRHEYCVSNTVLESDVLISVPKLKTHSKAGLTCALKNVIGVNCSKDYLPHYRCGSPSRKGDEYPDGALMAAAVGWLRGMAQSRIPLWMWGLFRRAATIVESRFGAQRVVQGGGWFGNDTLWRTIYDVMRIVQHYSPGGAVRTEPRSLLTFVDAVVCGEGNGPLRPTPVRRNLVLFGEDPGMVDCAAAEIMGFDWTSIPLLRHLVDEESRSFTQFAGSVGFTIDERSGVPAEAEARRPFVPPSTWPTAMVCRQA